MLFPQSHISSNMKYREIYLRICICRQILCINISAHSFRLHPPEISLNFEWIFNHHPLYVVTYLFQSTQSKILASGIVFRLELNYVRTMYKICFHNTFFIKVIMIFLPNELFFLALFKSLNANEIMSTYINAGFPL